MWKLDKSIWGFRICYEEFWPCCLFWHALYLMPWAVLLSLMLYNRLWILFSKRELGYLPNFQRRGNWRYWGNDLTHLMGIHLICFTLSEPTIARLQRTWMPNYRSNRFAFILLLGFIGVRPLERRLNEWSNICDQENN